jgi:hypothetical protein
MKVSEKIAVAALGTAVTYVAHRALTGAWLALTGEEPPDPHDPDVPTVVALTWALASGLGLGVAKLLVARHASKRYHAPSKPIHLQW